MSLIRSKYLFSFVVLLFIILSCNKETSVDRDTHAIMSLLLGNLSPAPPPAPPAPGTYKKDTIAFNRYVDSVSKLEVHIGILKYCAPIDVVARPTKEKLPKEYRLLADKLESLDACLDISKQLDVSKLPDNQKIQWIDNLYRGMFEDLNIDFYIAFSDVIFNTDKDKAIVYMSKNRHPMSGSISLILLEKINKKWKVHKSILLSIS